MFDSLRAKRGVGAAALTIPLVLTLAIAPAFAIGGGSGGGPHDGGGGGPSPGGGGSSPSATGDNSSTNDSGNSPSGLDNLTCSAGYVVDKKSHSCVHAERGAVPDLDLTEYAFVLAKHHRYEEALATLDLMQNPNTSEALNYRGYATRKLGKTDEGIGYYLQSVALDPAYPQVREYLGEAYVIKGRLDLAKEQLVTIASLCGTTCESYSALADAIAGRPMEE
jgi:hypothetical protein